MTVLTTVSDMLSKITSVYSGFNVKRDTLSILNALAILNLA
jgi:hypothetical protein